MVTSRRSSTTSCFASAPMFHVKPERTPTEPSRHPQRFIHDARSTPSCRRWSGRHDHASVEVADASQSSRGDNEDSSHPDDAPQSCLTVGRIRYPNPHHRTSARWSIVRSGTLATRDSVIDHMVSRETRHHTGESHDKATTGARDDTAQ